MKILALDTTAEGCSVAVNIDGQVREDYRDAPRQHTRLLIPMIGQLLTANGLRPADLDVIAFGRGPGSFTGLRIAAGVVQGLAYGLERPVIPVSSLAATALAAARRLGRPTKVAVAFDARMGELYWGCFDVNPETGSAYSLGPERVLPPDQIELPGEAGGDWLGAGDGWRQTAAMPAPLRLRVESVLENVGAEAGEIARLAARQWQEGTMVAPEEAVPVYLRDEVAWQKTASRD